MDYKKLVRVADSCGRVKDSVATEVEQALKSTFGSNVKTTMIGGRVWTGFVEGADEGAIKEVLSKALDGKFTVKSQDVHGKTKFFVDTCPDVTDSRKRVKDSATELDHPTGDKIVEEACALAEGQSFSFTASPEDEWNEDTIPDFILEQTDDIGEPVYVSAYLTATDDDGTQHWDVTRIDEYEY